MTLRRWKETAKEERISWKKGERETNNKPPTINLKGSSDGKFPHLLRTSLIIAWILINSIFLVYTCSYSTPPKTQEKHILEYTRRDPGLHIRESMILNFTQPIKQIQINKTEGNTLCPQRKFTTMHNPSTDTTKGLHRRKRAKPHETFRTYAEWYHNRLRLNNLQRTFTQMVATSIYYLSEILAEILIEGLANLINSFPQEAALALFMLTIFFSPKKNTNILLFFTLILVTCHQPANAHSVTVASVNLNGNSSIYTSLFNLAIRWGWEIIALQETGLSRSSAGIPKPEHNINHEDYIAFWNNPSNKRLTRNSNNKAVKKATRHHQQGKITTKQAQNQIDSAMSRQHPCSRGGTGFLIHKNIVGGCRFKTFKKGKRALRSGKTLAWHC